MPWFKVDDGLHAHIKAVRAGVSAMGLWVLAGSWSADQLTDGWVPDYIVARLDPDYREHAATLVRAGLWDEDEHDGDKGWRFHEWSDHQPSREQVLADRRAAAERQRRARERAKARRDGEREPIGSNPDRHGVTHAEVTPVVTVPPTRPDPTRPELPTEVQNPGAAKPRGVRDDDPAFAAFWDAYPRKDDKGHARKAWANALKRANAEQVIAGAQRFAATCARTNTERRFIPLPTTWLNGERWSDQPMPAAVNGHRPYRDPEDPATAYTQGL